MQHIKSKVKDKCANCSNIYYSDKYFLSERAILRNSKTAVAVDHTMFSSISRKMKRATGPTTWYDIEFEI